MCRLQNIAMRDYQKSVTTGQTDGQTDAGQSDPYVPLCFAGDTTSDRWNACGNKQSDPNVVPTKLQRRQTILTSVPSCFTNIQNLTFSIDEMKSYFRKK